MCQHGIRSGNYQFLVSLLRQGNISTLNQDTLNLLADLLEGNIKKKRGAHNKFIECTLANGEKHIMDLKERNESIFINFKIARDAGIVYKVTIGMLANAFGLGEMAIEQAIEATKRNHNPK